MFDEVKRLLIVSHVPHYRANGKLFAYGAYAREIDIWCELFAEVVIAAPFREETPPKDCLAFARSNVRVYPVVSSGGDSWAAKFHQCLLLPYLCFRLARAMNRADAIHVRCPGNLGLLGTFLGPLFSRRLIAKYAGNWLPYPGEPWTSRIQRGLLSSNWWKGPVTVYGDWPNTSENIVPFFTSIMENRHIARAQEAAARRRCSGPLRILFVGRLSKAKNVDVLLEAVSRLAEEGVAVECEVVGVGPERGDLEALSARLGTTEIVRFLGGLEFELVMDRYEWADVLVLASETEGWPKAIGEAMAFGVVCIGSRRGLVPWMLGEGRGMVVPPGEINSLRDSLKHMANSPETRGEMARRAAAWAQHYSLEGLREALRQLLVERWQLRYEMSEPSVAAGQSSPPANHGRRTA